MGVEVENLAITIADSDSIDFTLSGQQISAVVLPAGVDHNSLKNVHQDVNTIASPTFAKLIINSDTNGLVLGIDLDATLKWDNANARVDLDKPLAVGGVAGSIFYTNITAPNFISNIAIGTAPYACTSTTLNSNLNADLWDGSHFATYLNQALLTTSSPTFAGLTLTANPSIISSAYPISWSPSGVAGALVYSVDGNNFTLTIGGDLGLKIYAGGGSIYLQNLTTNGFVKTSGGTGFLSVDTTTYLPLAGGTMAGAINMGTYAITNAGAITGTSLKILESGATPTLYGIFSVPDLSTADKTYTFPSVSGSVAYSVLGTYAGIDTYINQTVLTTSAPTFANITDSGLTITRIPYASTGGLLVNSANLTFVDNATPSLSNLTIAGKITAASLVIDTTDLVVNATGYEHLVGIGTATPLATLHAVAGVSDWRFSQGASNVGPSMVVQNTGGGKAAALLAGSVGATFCFDAAGYFAIIGEPHSNFANNTLGGGPEYFRITSTGNVGIGTTTPERKLEVITADNNFISIGNSTAFLTSGAFVGASLGYVNAGNLYRKTAIVHESTGDAYTRGKFHILQNNHADSSNADLTDAVFTVLPTGLIGINKVAPTVALDVTGAGLFSTSLTAGTGFGCNSKTAQTAYASGGAAGGTPTLATGYGFVSAAEMNSHTALVENIRLALVANGIMS